MSAEVVLRVTVFVAALAMFTVLERLWPIRRRRGDRWARARSNLALMVTGAVLIRLCAPLAATGAAFFAQAQGIGLCNWLQWRFAVAFTVALVMLDLALYAQHVLLHSWGPLWRLHRVHHSDVDLDATSGVRFHPGEALLSMVYKSVVVILLGAPPAAVLVFELLLNVSSLFNHSNLRIAPAFERVLRYALVTPAMHWVHHSEVVAESQRNFGFGLSLWDRLFGTYLAQPAAGVDAMRLGVSGLDIGDGGIRALLRLPFAAATADEVDYRLGHKR